MSMLDYHHNQVPGDYYDTAIKRNLFQRYWHTRRFQEVQKILPLLSASRILDVGCHGGRFTNEIIKKFDKAVVYGVDISNAAIQYGKKRYRSVHFSVARAEKLPFHNSYFDLVTCFEVMEHIDDPEVVAQELYRVLEKNGNLLILVPTENIIFRFIWFFWIRFGPGKVWNHTHVQKFQRFALDKLLKQKGFTILRRKLFLANMLLLIQAKK